MNVRSTQNRAAKPSRRDDASAAHVRTNVQRARISAELTRAECAEMIDVTTATYCAFEAGRLPLSAKHIAALAKLFSRSVSSLVAPPAAPRRSADDH